MSLLEKLRQRSLIDHISSEDLEKFLSVPRKVYLGFDPTADSLHLGNYVGIAMLKWFQDHGHTPVILIGGATALIGDPSGKSVERPLADLSTVESNVASIKTLFERFLDFNHPTAKPIIVNNIDWLGQYPMIEFLRDVGKFFRMGSMLSKDSVRSRLQSEEGMSFTEFTYQMMQAYDFYHLFAEMDVSVQLGGSDQWGNMTAGMDFVKKKLGKSAFVMTFPLLTKSDGKKFGKSEKGAIWLSEDKCSVFDFYQFFMRADDADVIKLMKALTFMPLKDIQEYEQKINSSEFVPNEAQKRLAEEMTRIVHGQKALDQALRVTKASSFGADMELTEDHLSAIADEFPKVTLLKGDVLAVKYIELMVTAGLAKSKSEVSRLIQNNGAYLNNQKVSDQTLLIEEKDMIGGRFLLLGSGKKKKLLVELQ